MRRCAAGALERHPPGRARLGEWQPVHLEPDAAVWSFRALAAAAGVRLAAERPLPFLETRNSEAPSAGEALQAGGEMVYAGHRLVVFALGAASREHLDVFCPIGGTIIACRHAGAPDQASAARALVTPLGLLKAVALWAPLGLTVVALFFWLLVKRRIDLVNAAMLAGLAFLASAPSFLGTDRTLGGAATALAGGAFQALWTFLLWSAGESFLRSTEPAFTTSLDALRTGRLGPRGGRSLLFGFAGGTALAGLSLAARPAAGRGAPAARLGDRRPLLARHRGGRRPLRLRAR